MTTIKNYEWNDGYGNGKKQIRFRLEKAQHTSPG